jgi:uncharacterized MAPEG superfamily protein
MDRPSRCAGANVHYHRNAAQTGALRRRSAEATAGGQGGTDMTKELFWLTWTVVLTGLIWIPCILDRIVVRGLVRTLGNPLKDDKPHSVWAQRMMHAHANAIENLVVFGLLVLITDSLNIRTDLTAFACALYFWSRLAHVVVYAAGWPVGRTLAFLGGFIAQVILVLAIFNVV